MFLCILQSGSQEMLTYFGYDGEDNSNLSESCFNEIRQNQKKLKNQLIRLSLLGCLIILIIASYLWKKYAKNQQTSLPYIDFIINFFVLECLIQQVLNYQKELWIVLYFLFTQRISVQMGRRKFLILLVPIINLIYLILRLFIMRKFSGNLLIYSLSLLLFQILSLVFCSQINHRQQLQNQQGILQLKDKQQTPNQLKGILNSDYTHSKSQSKKYFNNQQKQANTEKFNSVPLRAEQNQQRYFQNVTHQNLIEVQPLQAIFNKDYSKQNTNENILSLSDNKLTKQIHKTKIDPNKIISTQEYEIYQNQENPEVNLASNPFFFASLQGIAIFDMQLNLIFENEQLSCMLNGFDQKESTANTIFQIKLIKNYIQTKDQIVHSKVSKQEDIQYEPILESQSYGRDQSQLEQKTPNNFTVKKSSQLYFQQQTLQQQQNEQKQEQTTQNQKYQIDILINNIDHNAAQSNILDYIKQLSKQQSGETNDILNGSSQAVTGVAVAGSTCDKVNNVEINEYSVENSKQLSPNIQFQMNNQKKQFFSGNINGDNSNILQESFNNISINQQLLGLNQDNKRRQSLIPLQYQGQHLRESQHSSLQNIMSRKSSFHNKELYQGNVLLNQPNLVYKKKDGLKQNYKLLELLRSNQDCTIKDILDILLDPSNYLKFVSEFIQNTNQKTNTNRAAQQEASGIRHASSCQESYASFSPKIQNSIPQQSGNKYSYFQYKKEQKELFDYTVDDCSVLINVQSQNSRITTTIKITIISQSSGYKEDSQIKQENLFAFLETSLSNQDYFQNQEKKNENLELFKQRQENYTYALQWIERKLRNILEPCLTRVNIFKQYQKQGCIKNLSRSEMKGLFITPLINSAQLFSNTLQNVFDYTQIIQGNFCLDMSQFNFIELLQECLSIFTQQAIFQNISVELKIQKNIHQKITSDYKRLKQLLINIVANAVKFTVQGKVVVEVAYDKQEGMYKISVSDTGIGIRREINQKLFSIFSQNINNSRLDIANLFFYNDSIYKESSKIQQNQQNNNNNNNNTQNNNLQNFSTFTYSFAGYQDSMMREELKQKPGFKLLISNYIAQSLGDNRPISFISELGKGSKFIIFLRDFTQPKSNIRLSSLSSKVQQKFHHQKEDSISSINLGRFSKDQQDQNTLTDKAPHKNMHQVFQGQTSLCKKVNTNDSNLNMKQDSDLLKKFQMKNIQNQQIEKTPSVPNINKIPSDNLIGTPTRITKQISESNINYKYQQQNKQLCQAHSKDSPMQKKRQQSSRNFKSALDSVFHDSESCNVTSEKNTQQAANPSYKHVPNQDYVMVTHKKKDYVYSCDDTAAVSSMKQDGKVNSSQFYRKCKTLTQIEIEQQLKNQSNSNDNEYEILYFGAISQGLQTYKTNRQKSHFYSEHTSELQTVLQPQNNINLAYQQKYPTTFYQCDNPMQSTLSNQNDSFINVSPSLNNFFTPGKSQNIIIYNNPIPKGSPKNKNQEGNEFYNPSHQDNYSKQKSPYKRSYSVRQANSEFIQSDPNTYAQKSSGDKQQCSNEKDEFQKYLVQDSPLFLQSFNAFKPSPDEQLHMIKKVQTEFTHQNSTIFQQGSPVSTITVRTKNTHRIGKFNFKKKQCGCSPILIIEQSENNLLTIKEQLKNFRLNADCCFVGKESRDKVRNKIKNSTCCPKYKLILIDIEQSEERAIKIAKEIMNICSVIASIPQPFICSCAPNQIPSNQILYGEAFDVFDYALQKPIDNDNLFDVLETALI